MTAIFPLKMKERKSSRKKLNEGNGSRGRKSSVSPNNARVSQGRSTERKKTKSQSKNHRALSQTNVEIYRTSVGAHTPKRACPKEYK